MTDNSFNGHCLVFLGVAIVYLKTFKEPIESCSNDIFAGQCSPDSLPAMCHIS